MAVTKLFYKILVILFKLVNGQWTSPDEFELIKDPHNSEEFIQVPNTQKDEDLELFRKSIFRVNRFIKLPYTRTA